MIRVSARSNHDHAGFFALTSADTEGPLLIHVNDVQHVSFDIDGYLPSGTRVLHKSGDSVVETIVFEPPEHVIRLIALAAKDLEKREELDFEQRLAFARSVRTDPDAF